LAANTFTENDLGWFLTILSVLTPIDPVDPKMAIFFMKPLGRSRGNNTKRESSQSNYQRHPKYGLCKPYGYRNIFEDVATCVEMKNENWVFALNGNDKYNLIYRSKLDLLYKYRFITEERYISILRDAGIK